MKIMEIVNVSLAGGVFHVALEQTRNLNRLGHETILLSNIHIPRTKEFFKEDLRVLYTFRSPLPKFAHKYFLGFLREFTGSLGVSKYDRRFKPDWVICHDLRSIQIATRIAEKTNAKICIIMHSINYPSSPIRYLTEFLLRRTPKHYSEIAVRYLQNANLVLAMGMDNVNLVKEVYDIETKSLPFGCNPLPKVPEVKRNYILYFGRLSLGKGVHKIAKAIALADNSTKVIFAGAFHATTPKVLKLIKRSGLRNYHVLINVNKDLKDKLLLHAKMLVYWRSETDFLLPACYGIPIVTCKKRYAGEVFVDGVHGRILDGNNDEDLIEKFADAISELLDNEQRAKAMGYNAWQLVRSKYTWLHHTQELLKYLNSVYPKC